MNPSEQNLFTEQISVSMRYAEMYYYALIELGLSELGPKNPIEYAFVIFSMVVSSILFKSVFGEITNFYMQFNSKEIKKQEELDKINHIFKSVGISITTINECHSQRA